jgi:hypothetical protein
MGLRGSPVVIVATGQIGHMVGCTDVDAVVEYHRANDGSSDVNQQ